MNRESVKAGLVIAQYHNFQGEEARLLYLKSRILSASEDISVQAEGRSTEVQARALKAIVLDDISDGREQPWDSEEERFDNLVCAYLR